jgi:hypothetical protein
MSKVTFIGQEPTKESKHIELVKYYASGLAANQYAKDFFRCDLVKRNVKSGLDFIMCYDLDEHIGFAFLGHWNDGTTSNNDTVCTVLGEDVAVKKGKGIEFVKLVSTEENKLSFGNPYRKPNQFKNIEVVRHGKKDCLSIFFCYDYEEYSGRQNGLLYLGHLNDGFVE